MTNYDEIRSLLLLGYIFPRLDTYAFCDPFCTIYMWIYFDRRLVRYGAYTHVPGTIYMFDLDCPVRGFVFLSESTFIYLRARDFAL